MELFSNNEKILLAKSDIDYRVNDKESSLENFTLKNLETKNDIHNKNSATKSAILAPFNSSLKDSLEDNYIFDIDFEDYMKLVGKVKEANMKYVMSHNCEFDNDNIIVDKDKKDAKDQKKDVKSEAMTPAEYINSGPLSPPDYSNRISNINTPRSDSLQKKSNSQSLTANTLVIGKLLKINF